MSFAKIFYHLALPGFFILHCQAQHNFKIEILDNTALSLIDANAEIKVIGEGFNWTEGTLYIEEGDYLLFSDIPSNTVYKIDAKGDKSVFLQPSGYLGQNSYGDEPGSNGLLLNENRELILLQHGERQVVKMKSDLNNPKAEYTVITNNYKGKRFNSPNDGVFDRAGNLYFTDPPYGLPKKMEDPAKELDFQGVYCLLHSGELLLLDKLSRPNGITLSPDESKLYVAVSDPEHAVWYQYDVTDIGTVANKKLLYDVTHLIGKEGQQGLPDGMKTHSSGNLFATGPGGVFIINPKGKPIARIHTGQATANCAFSSDEKRLFLAADDYVLEVTLKQF
ncbi:SMP-30/gluconolactonase/LRE family protein [Aurantibacter sp.]|uniref:SMP-30/gluconolactonase/LRE family protein n=1 Tax=Aurantibacter sp. TaxID=2807103 RepID=UPI003266F5FB